MDKAREAQQEGRPWTESIAFDYSLAIGEWIEGQSDKGQSTKELSTTELSTKELVLSPEEAIVEASRVMTIRQGDLIYIQYKQAPRTVQKEEIIRVEIDGEEKLYCKIT
jgi:2-keto-4-pentenoate hydratase/2-oxohepta-3-ene-1,7-dioic acid hydratase in catechol pathway